MKLKSYESWRLTFLTVQYLQCFMRGFIFEIRQELRVH